MDVGASTGGFTDCVLQKGAKKVYAVDVGYGKLAWKLQKDPRVINLERRNIRYLKREEIPEESRPNPHRYVFHFDRKVPSTPAQVSEMGRHSRQPDQTSI